MRDISDLLGDLVGTNEEVRIVLRELSDAKESVQGTLELVAVVETGLGELERQVTVGTRLGLVDEARTWAVHARAGRRDASRPRHQTHARDGAGRD